MRVKHVFRAAQHIAPEENFRSDIDYPHHIDENRRDSLTRNQQVIIENESSACEENCDVAKMKEVHGAPRMPIRGNPDGKPNERAQAQHNWKCFRCRGVHSAQMLSERVRAAKRKRE